MATIKFWIVYESTWMRPIWENDEDWGEPSYEALPKYYLKHETAHDAIVKRVATACDKYNGKVIRNENCSDGYVFYEWTEERDGLLYRKWMQIAAHGEELITD